MSIDSPRLIIDSNYLGYAALHSMGDLSHEDMKTGVIFGFLSRINSLCRFFVTNDIVFCWDSKHSYRKKQFSGYKKKREDRTPEEEEKRRIAQKQFVTLRRGILPKIGFNSNLMQPGVEADDIMGRLAINSICDLIIVSADRDLYQLLFQNVKIWNPSQKKMMTPKKFKEEYGIYPYQWMGAKAIAGCPSDNVPGVDGVGIKTAIKHIRNELNPTSKKKRAIIAGANIIHRNSELIHIPHPKTKCSWITPRNDFSLKGFKSVCRKYGLESFLEKEELREWKQLFDGYRMRPPRMRRTK